MNLIGVDEVQQTERELETEMNVLGSIFLEPSSLDEVVFLEPRDFLSTRHQQIFKVMLWLDKRNKPVDITTVGEMYLQHNRQDEVGIGYLTELAMSVPTAANVKHYAEIVRSRALKRRGADVGQKIKNLVYEEFETDEDYFTAIERLVSDVRPEDNGQMESLADARMKYFEHLITKAEFILTGFPKFDKWARVKNIFQK